MLSLQSSKSSAQSPIIKIKCDYSETFYNYYRKVRIEETLTKGCLVLRLAIICSVSSYDLYSGS